jgi:23S rRNA (cytidine1920-2'-O)/16S rRNA (cytidine1409-2'-O)-methyltransferase
MVRTHDEDGIRLDKALVDRGIVPSRARAQSLIRSRGVKVNGKIVTEKDFVTDEMADIVLVIEDLKWVSRGGLKLAHALQFWHIDVKNKVAIDVGASTGGFTDVLLDLGAKKVYALDVGRGQLAPKLVADKRVVNMEGVHIKDVTKAHFKEKIDLVVVDVSFISLEKVLPSIKDLIKKKGVLIALIKPQFEVGKELIGKGIVTDPKLHAKVANRIEGVVHELGFHVEGVVASPILGGDGNREFLIYAHIGITAPTVV